MFLSVMSSHTILRFSFAVFSHGKGPRYTMSNINAPNHSLGNSSLSTASRCPKISIGVYQAAPRASPEHSIAAIVSSVRQAAAERNSKEVEGPLIILFSELFVGGYGSGAGLIDAAIDVHNANGPHHDWFVTIADECKSSRVAVAFGFVEHSAGKYFNACVCIGDDGLLLACYRKTHLWGAYERSFFAAGDDLLAGRFRFNGIEFGTLICFDVEFPETVRTLRRNGAEVVLVPTALVNAFNANVTVPSRAFENNCIVVYANEVGNELPTSALPTLVYCGLSVVAFPDGTSKRMRGNDSDNVSDNGGLMLVDVNVDAPEYIAARERNNYLGSLRPDLYTQ